MNNSNSLSNIMASVINGVIGRGIFLTLIFVILKVHRILYWSWLWVFSPFFVAIIITLVVALICSKKS